MHILGPWIGAAPPGSQLFADISTEKAIGTLRIMLAAVGVKKAASFRTHDLRRGHAEDLRQSGVAVCGGWGGW